MILSVDTIRKLAEGNNDPDIAAVLKSYEYMREELSHASELADEWMRLFRQAERRIIEQGQILDDIQKQLCEITGK